MKSSKALPVLGSTNEYRSQYGYSPTIRSPHSLIVLIRNSCPFGAWSDTQCFCSSTRYTRSSFVSFRPATAILMGSAAVAFPLEKTKIGEFSAGWYFTDLNLLSVLCEKAKPTTQREAIAKRHLIFSSADGGKYIPCFLLRLDDLPLSQFSQVLSESRVVGKAAVQVQFSRCNLSKRDGRTHLLFRRSSWREVSAHFNWNKGAIFSANHRLHNRGIP